MSAPRLVAPDEWIPAPIEPQSDEVDLWARPVLRHVRTFARARGVGPLACLGSVLARVVAGTPSDYVLPPLVGRVGSLNLFVAKVAASGQGKGASDGAAEDAVFLSGVEDPDTGDDELFSTTPGSGEGLLHVYVTREKDGTLRRLRDRVLFDVPEIDALTAVASRQGATIMPLLRQAYSGERLGFHYSDPGKRLTVRGHTYRCAMVVGVQPGRAAALLDDADGGTPQRFLWLPVTDPQAPAVRPPEPRPWRLELPAVTGGRRELLQVCPEAVTTIEDAARRRLLGQADNALDGHALYTRLKVAAALALLEERLDVNPEDWQLAGALMAISDTTRDAVQDELRQAAAHKNLARADAEATRAVRVAGAVEEDAVKRIALAVTRKLDKQPGEWITGADLRRALASKQRAHLEDALELLATTGQIEAEELPGQGTAGHRYRRPR